MHHDLPHDAAMPESDAAYKQYQKVLKFLFVWIAAVMVAVFSIDAPPFDPSYDDAEYSSTHGYFYSLILLYLPLVFLVFWYRQKRDEKQLRPLLRSLLSVVAVGAGVWVVLDVALANLFFLFPNADAQFLPAFWAFLWKDDCNSFWQFLKIPSCYPRSIPSEEVLFYAGAGALLTAMYMWAVEDFYSLYTLPRRDYIEEAKKVGPLIHWNRKLIALGIAIVAIGTLLKWLLGGGTGRIPLYLLAQVLIVFIPVSALYDRVHRFTNPRAFLFVLLLAVFVSTVWEVTLAIPFGWWNYQGHAMVGIYIPAWSNLAIEAPGLWLSIGWTSMFAYEVCKIKALTDRTWRQVLFGTAPRAAAAPELIAS